MYKYHEGCSIQNNKAHHPKDDGVRSPEVHFRVNPIVVQMQEHEGLCDAEQSYGAPTRCSAEDGSSQCASKEWKTYRDIPSGPSWRNDLGMAYLTHEIEHSQQ